MMGQTTTYQLISQISESSTVGWGNKSPWNLKTNLLDVLPCHLLQPSPRQVQSFCFHEKYHGMSRKVGDPSRRGLGCSRSHSAHRFTGEATGLQTVHPRGWGIFRWVKPLQVVSQKTNGWNLKMGGFLGKGYSFWNPFIKFQISVRRVRFRFRLKQYGSNEKQQAKKTLLWKKRSQNFDVSVVWGWCGMRCSCFRYQLKYGLKNVAMFLVGSLSFRESWGQKIMKTRRYYFPHGSPWPGCCWQLNTFLLVWLVLKSSNIVYWELWEESWCHVTSIWSRNKSLGSDQMVEDGEFLASKFRTNFRLCMEQATNGHLEALFQGPCPSGSSHIKSVFNRWNKTTTTFGMFTTFFSPFWNFQGYITRALNQGNKKHRKERIFMMLKASPTT